MRNTAKLITSGNGPKVTVACKVPLGVVLHVDERTERVVETPSGAKTVIEYQRGSERVAILGPAYPVGSPPEGFREKPMIVGGYALTPGVDKEFWEKWWADNADARCKPDELTHKNGCKCTAIVKSRMILAYERLEDVRSAARDGKDLRSGLEPISPDGDYRAPRPLAGSGITVVKSEVAPLPNN